MPFRMPLDPDPLRLLTDVVAFAEHMERYPDKPGLAVHAFQLLQAMLAAMRGEPT